MEKSNEIVKLVAPVKENMFIYNGDYHYAKSLQKALEKFGFKVEFRFWEHWYDAFKGKFVIVLRGLYEYKCDPHNINIMWQISHPDLVSILEYNNYDYVFVASNPWKKILERLLKKYDINTQLEVALQCTDLNLFYSPINYDRGDLFEILFVGINHTEGRKIIDDIVKYDTNLKIYGPGWDEISYAKYWSGEGVPNNELKYYYNRSKIVLNDTRKYMKMCGFVPNRIFDVLASGGFVLTEYDEQIEKIFGKGVVMYDGTKEDLKDKIDYYLENYDERKKVSEIGQEVVLKKHNFESRVVEMMRVVLS